MKMKYLFIGLLVMFTAILTGCNTVANVPLSDGSTRTAVIPRGSTVVESSIMPSGNIVARLDDGTLIDLGIAPEGVALGGKPYTESQWRPEVTAVAEAAKTIPGFEWIGYALSGILAVGGVFMKKNLTIQQRMTQALAQGIDAFRNTLDVMPNRELAEKLDSELTRLLKEFQKGANVLSEIQALLKQVETPDMKLLDMGATVEKA